MQTFTLHTHTIGFDGANTIAEMAASARAAGFSALGVSNHFIVHPEITHARMYPHAVRGGYDAISPALCGTAPISINHRHANSVRNGSGLFPQRLVARWIFACD